ncbi:hypothetical protein ACH3VR_01740 [Microbacterium sp. B2969]|uniref:Uncharacterized protein n=1 Tax=Microbacterium alkaliflavum TaxID=3248839 RepID=A0ABW7Q614_9MICO
MSANESNLSDPQYGYDLVVATTQKSMNVALKAYLDGLGGPLVVACYVYDNDNNLVPISYEQLKADAKGSDPFSVPGGSDPKTDQDLLNLAAANFAGGFRAKAGLPQMPPLKLPPVVTLGNGPTAPVTFNLLCSEFDIAGFNYGPRGSSKWINAAQPADDPWYFVSQVQLNNDVIDPHSPVPPAVQQKIQELIDSVGAGAFSIEKVFLDLSTAMLLSAPTIAGISSKDWPVWALLSSVFLDAYIGELRKTGHPVLGYSCTVDKPKPGTLPIRMLVHECCALVDSSGVPVVDPTKAQQDATTFNYLCTTSTTKPVAHAFRWNWLESTETGTWAGIQSVRRDVFIAYLQSVFNDLVAPISFTPAVSWSQPQSNGYVSLNIGIPAGGGAQFAAKPVNGKITGPTQILSLEFDKPATGSISPAGVGYWGDWFSYTLNYKLTGDVSALVQGDAPCVRLRLRATFYEEFRHTEAWIAPYHDLPGANYIDYLVEVLFQISVTDDGKLVVNNAKPSVTDSSTPWYFYKEGIYGLSKEYEQYILARVNPVHTQIKALVNGTFTDIAAKLQGILNNTQSWVFPGSETYAFGKVAFSDYLDFITHTTFIGAR